MRRAAPFLLAACLSLSCGTFAEETANVRMADGFDPPVGREGSKKYYMARGFRANGHLGEDWDGTGGGDTDFGDPVYSIAHGLVVFARDYRRGWGNVVILRHAYVENGTTQFVDSLYGHLNEILVQEGQQIVRGQKLGTIGNNRGMYAAHLHFEMRKNLRVGMFRNSFPRDFSVYWDPTAFIAAHRTLGQGAMTAAVPINTFPAGAPPVVAAPETPIVRSGTAPAKAGSFKIDRYEDMR